MTKSNTQIMYERHHKTSRGESFSILKEERGQLFKRLIGVNHTVLDIGCRDGALTSFFTEGNTVLGVDVDEVSLKRAEERGIRTMSMDVYGSWNELQGQTFDCIVMGEVLEHLFYPDEIVKKIKAHLNPRGVYVGSVPNAFSAINRLRYFFGTKKHTPLSDPTHINHFSAKELEHMLKNHFSEVRIIGLGRTGFLARFCPQLFAFDLCFEARV